MPVMSPSEPSAPAGYAYDAQFLSYSQRISAQSAKEITLLLPDLLAVESVLDVGCAQGTWLNHWRQSGVEDIVGVDGDYVVRDRLEIPPERFIAQDVSEPFDLDRQFDLVQCLEVAEHIAADHATTLIDNLTRHGACILFSAAPPGQGGEYHVNEQPYDYWRELFAQRGYAALDAVRPLIRDKVDVAIWYRHNIILYVRNDLLPQLPETLRESVIPRESSIPDVSSPTYRIRKAIVRHIPATLQLELAKLVARLRG